MFIRLRQTDGQADETTAKREVPMNRVYRLIVNHTLGCLQVASEHARRGKGSGSGAVRCGCVGGTGKDAYPQEKVLVGQILQALRPVLPVIVLGMLAPGMASAHTINNSITGYTVTGNTISQVSITSAGSVSGTLAVSTTGTISESLYGIVNSGSIDSLINSGFISGDYSGIYNAGSIVNLSNNGTITGLGNGPGDGPGGIGININNYGSSIGTLINSGLIQGRTTGIYLDGAGTTLTNTGTIIGKTDAIDIANSNASTLIFGTGSDIKGTINAGTSASTVELQGTPTLGTIAPISLADGTLDNQGTLTGEDYGIVNDANGTLAANENANVLGSLALLENSGSITTISFR